jgi:hypothetical protein
VGRQYRHPAALTVAAVLALLLTGVASAQPAPLRLLFIGNSLTYLNDVPSLVAALGRANGRPVVCEQVAAPDLGLEEHWRQGEAGRTIARGGWDIVILQQGPSALPESRTLLIDYTRRFDREITKTGARTALYMVWPAQARRGDFPGVSRSYTAAADAVSALLLPAGDAWREAWQLDARLALYGADGFHASLLGSQLAAIVIFEGVTGQPAATLPFDLLASQASALQQAAARVRHR